MKRRDFLRTSAATLVALGIGRHGKSVVRAAAVDEGKMKRVGVTTTCFRTLFAATRPKDYPTPEKDLTLLEIPALFADQFGVHNIELWVPHFAEDTDAYAQKLRRAAEAAGSVITNIQLDGPKYNLSDARPDERAKSVGLVKSWMDRAAVCGATSLRANTGGWGGGVFDLGATADSYHKLAEHGRKIGVKILVENHGGFSSQFENVAAIVSKVDSPWCRSLPDFGNLPPNAATQTDREAMLKTLFPLAHVASAKGMDFDESGRHIPYDIGQCVRIGEQCGFQGLYSAEYYDPQHRVYDPLEVTQWIIDSIVANI